MLTNINSNKDELLQIILLGQPELREKISDPAFVSSRSASPQHTISTRWIYRQHGSISAIV